MLPYSRHIVDDEDVRAVTEVLVGDFLTTGPAISAFEESVAHQVGAKHAVAFSSATAALHGACFAAGLSVGDTVHTSPLTFIASANCARYVGATPALIDIEESTFNLDPAQVGPDVQALIAVHYAGLPMDLSRLAHRPRVLIEDASHALGAITPDGPVGNCAISDMTVFSFHPVKPITTGEGGMVTTNDDRLSSALRRFRSHGLVRAEDPLSWKYDAIELGYNYRLTDFQAALGVTQMQKLPRFIDRRNALASRYRTLLADAPIDLPPMAPVGFTHGYHLFAIRVAERDRVFKALRTEGIGVQVHYVPVHHHTVSKDIHIPVGGLPVVDAVYERIISLPLHPGLTNEQQDDVVQALLQLL